MAEATQITFKHTELVELMIKKQEIHEGIWGLFVNFGFSASNIGSTPTDLSPAAIVGILGIGLQKFDKVSSIAVDAAVVNPRVTELAEK
jgi:hypothetical protein